jgi:hypothetical protein
MVTVNGSISLRKYVQSLGGKISALTCLRFILWQLLSILCFYISCGMWCKVCKANTLMSLSINVVAEVKYEQDLQA